MYRKYIDHIHPSLSSLPSSTLPLWPVLHPFIV
jgi:hypothetical protein